MPTSVAQAGARPALLETHELGETKGKILEAAFRRLVAQGYAALSVREIARDAGVNHALINYHFRTKDQLVLAVLDEANRQLLARQRAMYARPGGYAEKWARARDFYRDDLASGFVRLQAELWAASLSNVALREKFAPRILAWKKVVGEAVAGAVQTLERCGVSLPPPFTPDVIATWISDFWLGMEFADLLGPHERASHKAALDAVERLLEDLDARVEAAARPSRSKSERRQR
jgi:AcrR family transcriptional regulator